MSERDDLAYVRDILEAIADKLIHGYLGVDLDVVWGTVQDDLPSLYEKLTGILEDAGPRS